MNDLDSKIAEKRKLINKLQEEIAELEAEKMKLSHNYIGRAFEMKNSEYMYITEEWSGELYGISFQKHECTNSIEIYRNCRFNADNIKKEISYDLFREKLKRAIVYDELKEILSGTYKISDMREGE